jgi:hypothetical protein
MMAPKGKTKAKVKAKRKGKEQQHADRDLSSPLSTAAPARFIESVHPPTSDVVLTVEHSLELVKTVVTATVRVSFPQMCD